MDSSLRLLVLFSVEGMLSKEEVKEVAMAMEACDPSLFRRYSRCSYKSIVPLFVGMVALAPCLSTLSFPWYVNGLLILLFLLAISGCMYWLYCVRIRHFQHAVSPVDGSRKCPRTHRRLRSLFVSVTEQPQQHYTIDKDKPAEILVGDVPLSCVDHA